MGLLFVQPSVVGVGVGNWEVQRVRKALTAGPVDGPHVDTGIVYDREYEYMVAAFVNPSPFPDPATPIIVGAMSGWRNINSTGQGAQGRMVFSPNGGTNVFVSPPNWAGDAYGRCGGLEAFGNPFTSADDIQLARTPNGNEVIFRKRIADPAAGFWWRFNGGENVYFVIARRKMTA